MAGGTLYVGPAHCKLVLKAEPENCESRKIVIRFDDDIFDRKLKMAALVYLCVEVGIGA